MPSSSLSWLTSSSPCGDEEIPSLAQLLHPALPLSLGLIVEDYWLNPLHPALFKRLSHEARVRSLPRVIALLEDAVPSDVAPVLSWLLDTFPSDPWREEIDARATGDEVRAHYEACLPLLLRRTTVTSPDALRRIVNPHGHGRIVAGQITWSGHTQDDIGQARYLLRCAAPALDDRELQWLILPLVKDVRQPHQACAMMSLCLQPNVLGCLARPRYHRERHRLAKSAKLWRRKHPTHTPLVSLCDDLLAIATAEKWRLPASGPENMVHR